VEGQEKTADSGWILATHFRGHKLRRNDKEILRYAQNDKGGVRLPRIARNDGEKN